MLDLVPALLLIILVDAYGVDPQNPVFVLITKTNQSVVQVYSNCKFALVYSDPEHFGGTCPRVSKCFIVDRVIVLDKCVKQLALYRALDSSNQSH